LIGQSLPARPFAGEVIEGTAIRIMTGAPMPSGADAVLPAEFARVVGEHVEFTTAIAPGRNIGHRGEDVAAGATVLDSGRRLRPQDLGLLASLGVPSVSVFARPRVRVLATGDELAAVGDARKPYQIFDSNSPTLHALIERDGGELESSRRLIDDRAAIAAALTEPGADIILVSGGSSVGDEDHAPAVLSEVGALPIHGIAMRPSSPTGIGHIGDVLVFLLPGNPVSCLCAYDFFAGRAIRKLGGRSGDWPYLRHRAIVGSKIVSAVGRVDYCRVRIESGHIEPIATSGASILSSTTRAAGFVVVPAELEGYAPGTEVEVFLYDPLS
jgi:molybdopterin molybdotransferase